MHRSFVILAALALAVAASACSAGASPSLPASPSPASQASPSPAGPSPGTSPSRSNQASSSPLSCVSGDNAFTADARGPNGDFVSIAQEAVGGVEAEDRFEVGRDEAGSTVVRINRAGQEIGTLWYSQDPDGGWLLTQWNICAGLSVR
jgi:hypothetical protein